MNPTVTTERRNIQYNDGELTLFGIRGKLIDGIPHTSDPQLFTYCQHQRRDTMPLMPYLTDEPARKRLIRQVFERWDDEDDEKQTTYAYIDATDAVALFLEGVLTPTNIARAYEKDSMVVFPRKRIEGRRVTISVHAALELSPYLAKEGGRPEQCMECVVEYLQQLNETSEALEPLITGLQRWHEVAWKTSTFYSQAIAAGEMTPNMQATLADISQRSRNILGKASQIVAALPLMKR